MTKQCYPFFCTLNMEDYFVTVNAQLLLKAINKDLNIKLVPHKTFLSLIDWMTGIIINPTFFSTDLKICLWHFGPIDSFQLYNR